MGAALRSWVPYDPNSLDYDMGGERHLYLFSLSHTPQSKCNESPSLGTDCDVATLQHTFESVGFTVHKLCDDLTHTTVFQILDAMCEMNHTNTSCVVFVFLAHGDTGGRVRAGAETFFLKNVVNRVLLAPNLAGKPKLFFNQVTTLESVEISNTMRASSPTAFPTNAAEMAEIEHKPECEACRRDNCDRGHRVYVHKRVAHTIPTLSDCLVMTSFEDAASLLSRRGSWFVQALCDVMAKHHGDLDVVDMATLVNRSLRINSPTSTMTPAQKPTLKFQFTLTKSLRFSIDNSLNHKKYVGRPPNSNTIKQEMIDWLNRHEIPVDPKLTKTQIYAIICQHKERYTEFSVDKVLAEHGHTVLRMPPYHPDFNPIENICSQLKGYVASRNVGMNLTTVKTLLTEKANMIGAEEWEKVCGHAIKCDNEYRSIQHGLDNYTDRLVINTADSDSDIDLFESTDSEMEVIEN